MTAHTEFRDVVKTTMAIAKTVEAFCEVDRAIKAATEKRDALKAQLLAFHDAGADLVGPDHVVNVTDKTRLTLDKAAVVDVLGADWVDAHSKLTAFKSLTIKERFQV